MAKLTKLSHAQAIALQAERNAELIRTLLDWSEDQYNTFQYESGVEYAKIMTDGDEYGLSFILNARFFWQYWKNEWAKRNIEFLDSYSFQASAELLVRVYSTINSAKRLSGNTVMNKIHAHAVGMAIDEQMKGGYQYA